MSGIDDTFELYKNDVIEKEKNKLRNTGDFSTEEALEKAAEDAAEEIMKQVCTSPRPNIETSKKPPRLRRK